MKLVLLLTVATAVAVPLAGCGGSSSNNSSTASKAAAPAKCNGDKLSFQLGFFPNAQHSGFLVAQNRGYYKDAGLKVKIKPGGPTVDPDLLLAQGNVNMGLTDNFALVAQSKGAPITLVGETDRTDPGVLIAKASSGIKGAADLKGKSIGLQRTGAHPDLEAILHSVGLTDSDVKLKSMGFGIDDIESGKVDAGTQQLFFHKAQWEDAGYKWPAQGQSTSSGPKGLTVLDPSSFTNVGFGEAIGVNNDYLSSHPDAVGCFLRASRRGWQFALAHPKAALNDVMKFLPKGVSTPKDQYTDLVEENRLVMPPGTAPSDLLKITTPQVQAAVSFLKKYKVMKGNVDVSKVVNTSFLK